MSLKLSLRVLLRAPVKMLLTFVLIAAASFALLSRVAEHTITAREMDKLAASYQGIGAVERAPAGETRLDTDDFLMADTRNTDYPQKLWAFARYQGLTAADRALVAAQPYVTGTSTRYMTAGISLAYQRLDDRPDQYNYTARLVLEVTLRDIKEHPDNPLLAALDYDYRWYEVTFSDIAVLAGDTNWKGLLSYITSFLPVYLPDRTPDLLDARGTGYVNRAISMSGTNYDANTLAALQKGQRYVIVLRYDPSRQDVSHIGDRASEPWCDSIIPLEGQSDNYLELAQFANLRELIAITQADMHTLDVVYTDSMASILRFSEQKMAMHEGRMLNEQDSTAQAQVCVISNGFANAYRLNVGDTLVLGLSDILQEQHVGLGAVASTPWRYAPPVTEIALEIVGIYTDLDTVRAQAQTPNWSYTTNTVFVPLSLLPADTATVAAHTPKPGEFSFIIDNAWNLLPFIESIQPQLEAQGFIVTLSDGGWLGLQKAFQRTTTLAIIGITAMLAATMAALGLIVFLFIGRKKREFAIMRALGTPKAKAMGALFWPLLLLALFAIVTGNAAAWLYTEQTVSRTLTNSLEGIESIAINASVPLSAIGWCLLCEVALLCVFVGFGLWRLGRQPPLALLQANTKTKRTKRIPTCAPSPVPPHSQKFHLPPKSAGAKRYNALRHTTRYLLRHSRRAWVKTLLCVLLSALLFGAIGQFAAMRASNRQLFDSMVIKATYNNGLDLDAALEIAASGSVSQPYYEYSPPTLECNGYPVSVHMTNDLPRFLGEAAAIEFAEGYDATALSGQEAVCVLGADTMLALNVALGDTVRLMDWETRQFLSQYAGEPAYYQELAATMSAAYTVVGHLKDELVNDRNAVYIPANRVLKTEGVYAFLPLEMAEFKLLNNETASAFRHYAEEKLDYPSNGNGVTLVMDTTQLDKVGETAKLYNLLFPVIVAVLSLLGGLLSGLMIAQSAREASILRVLGTTKTRTRWMLSTEQFVICLLGLLCGAVFVRVYNGAALFGSIVATIVLCFSLYALACASGAVISAIAVTRAKVLELLQTKE